MESVPEDAQTTAAGTPSRWEWLPVLGLAALICVYLMTPPDSRPHRFALFVGLGLVPGTLWRLAGRRSWNIHRMCFAASLVAVVLDNPDLRPDAGTWEKMSGNWWVVVLGFLVSFTQPLWGMARTRRLLNDSGVGITYYDSLKLCLIGSFFNIFLPGSTGGDAYRIYAVTTGYKTKLGTAVASISLDRILGLPSLILVVAAGMAVDHRFFLGNSVLRRLAPFIAVTGTVCLALVVYLTLAGRGSRRTAAGSGQKERGSAGWLGRLHAVVAGNVTRPATLPLALFHGFMSHIACIASCQLFGQALGVQGVPGIRYYLIVPMAMAINAIPGAPGGVGQGELAMATLLDMASPGLGNAQNGVVIMLLFRLSNMIMGLVGGAFYALGKTEYGEAARMQDDMTAIVREGMSTVLGDGGPEAENAETAAPVEAP